MKKRLLDPVLKENIITREQYDQHLSRLEASLDSKKLERNRLLKILMIPAFLIGLGLINAPKGGNYLGFHNKGIPLKVKPREDNQIVVEFQHTSCLGYARMYDSDGDSRLDKVFEVSGGLPRGFLPIKRLPGDRSFDRYQKIYKMLYKAGRQKVESGGFDIYRGIF